jgi:hypothetical protein
MLEFESESGGTEVGGAIAEVIVGPRTVEGITGGEVEDA